MNASVKNHTSAVKIWLVACMLLVACMVLVGGYTRLSGSGLSITEWKPIHGIIPPMNEREWQEEFDGYRAIPQYQLINKGMSLEEFKTIYWPEYWHRVLGRLVGFVFLLPLAYFTLRGAISRRFALRLTGIFALGGLQGLIGWYMVSSGLAENTHVSHLRLALHLSIAFLIFALLLWALLDIAGSEPRAVGRNKSLPTLHRPLFTYSFWFLLLCLQIMLGAFVAGQHAGLAYNTWPTMNGQWLPSELWWQGAWHENLALIQFLHRKLAVFLALSFIIWWYLCRAYVRDNHLGKAAFGVTAVIVIQFVLGVLTLLHHVPLPLALAHQMTALLLFAFAVWLLHGTTGKRTQAS